MAGRRSARTAPRSPKSCRVDPETKPRQGRGGKRSARTRPSTSAGDAWQKTIRVGPKGSYVVNEMDGFLHSAQFLTNDAGSTDVAENDPDAV